MARRGVVSCVLAALMAFVGPAHAGWFRNCQRRLEYFVSPAGKKKDIRAARQLIEGLRDHWLANDRCLDVLLACRGPMKTDGGADRANLGHVSRLSVGLMEIEWRFIQLFSANERQLALTELSRSDFAPVLKARMRIVLDASHLELDQYLAVPLNQSRLTERWTDFGVRKDSAGTPR